MSIVLTALGLSAMKGTYKQIKYAFRDYMGKVQYDSEVQKSAASTVGQGANILQDQIQRMNQAIMDLDDGWKGAGANAFRDNYMKPTKDDLDRFTDLIITYQHLIEKIAALYDELTYEAEQLKLQ